MLWGHRGSNPGPADYESAALTDWAIAPKRRSNRRFKDMLHQAIRDQFHCLDVAFLQAFPPCRFGVVGTASPRSWYRYSAYPVLQGGFLS